MPASARCPPTLAPGRRPALRSIGRALLKVNRGAGLALQPRFKFSRRHDSQRAFHGRVANAAELGAVDLVGIGLGDFEMSGDSHPGNRILSDAQREHFERDMGTLLEIFRNDPTLVGNAPDSTRSQ